MTAPPWGHKPPAVTDPEQHWNTPPPAPSARCQYWIRRHRDGTWHPNRLIRREGYHSAAEHLGIWIWEYLNLIRPLFDEDDPLTREPELLDEQVAGCNSES
ncbi:hypothetical protein ABZ438_08080 [Streptomyces sp. NPDC005786]|uniref:hypothetical protein n=1 Tax=Streptomyces sp. NPDC005786 TaxID=3154891 RepID=UPI00340890AA